VIVFVSLPLFTLAGRVSQRRGPAVAIAGAMAARVILLAALAGFAAAGHVPAIAAPRGRHDRSGRLAAIARRRGTASVALPTRI